MNDLSAQRRLEHLEQAIARLEEVLAAPADTPFIVDATIQRFEFAFELCWKTMRGFLELETSGANLSTARAVLRHAYTAGWVDDQQGWIDLLAMRNLTSHVYNEKMAREIYERIGVQMPLLRKALVVLQTKAN